MGWPAVVALGDGQRRLITRRQLRLAGFGRGAIRGLVSDGLLYPVFNRVYAIGTPEWQRFGLVTAACLNFEHDLVVSHRSAVALWHLLEPSDELIVLTLVGRGLRARAGVRLHRVPRLDIRDVRLRHGLPVTAPARTLLDHAAGATTLGLEDVLGQARADGLVDDHELAAALERAPYRSGDAALRRILATPVGAAITRSRFERRLLALLVAAGLPLPEVNVRLHGYEVDFAWREQRLILETDGWDFHRGRQAFERDRRRDADHAAHGFRTIRITWARLDAEPMAVVALIAAALAAAP